VLVGRDSFLALARGRIDAMAAGNGGLLLIAGEAGIGKTRFLASVSRYAQSSGHNVVRAAAFPGDVEAYGGVLLDLAEDLRRSVRPAFVEAGTSIAARLREAVSGDGDQHRMRRLLVGDLVDALAGIAAIGPTMVVLEDLHWADELSLDVLGRLVRRVGDSPMLVASAYRSDELYPRRPVRDWRARLLTQRLADEYRLPRLTLDETATVASAVMGLRAPTKVVAAVHERSDGIPLHIEEFVAALDPAAWAAESGDSVRDVPVPDTLADAIMLRAGALDAASRDIASAAAVIGRSFDFDLLVTASERDASTVERCLRRLQDAYFVVAGAATTYDFRHALIRDTLYAQTGPVRRRRLHLRVATEAANRAYPDSFVSAQFELANATPEAYEYATRAGRDAAAVSAHGEAFELFGRAVRNRPADLPVSEQASLLIAYGDEAAAMDHNTIASASYQTAYDLLSSAGDTTGAADVVPRQAAVAHLLGEGLDARTARIGRALDSLRRGSANDAVRVRLLGAMAAAYMLDRRLDDAIRFAEEGRELSQRISDEATELDITTTLGSVLVFAGAMAGGWALLEYAVDRAIHQRREAESARGYRMVGSSASALVEYERATTWLGRGIGYAERVELWNHRHYMAAHLAHVQWATGEWDAAWQTAEHALADGRGGITTRITALYVLGYVAMGRGDFVVATEYLTEALELGERMRELQRISPPLWGLAEVALLGDEYDVAIERCERGYALSADVADAAYLFPYLLTGVRARLASGDQAGAEEWSVRVGKALSNRAIPGTLPAIDHAYGLIRQAAGDLGVARASLGRACEAWRERARYWEGAWSIVDRARVAFAERRRAEAIRLVAEVRAAVSPAGAISVFQAADRLMANGAGDRSAPAWHPLTAREFQVARLIGEGMTNPQIGAALGLSPKTVAAHIEHILTKLSASRRTEIATWTVSVASEGR
jgi:DNA-binding CsgD family transcriptional regulator/tetratricopeptide (TPR) repeat protein